MRNQSANPLLKRYRNLLAPSGRYFQKDVQILWKQKGKLVSEVEVVFIPRAVMPDFATHRDIWDGFDRHIEQWDCDLGNSITGWLEDEGATPAGVFGRLLRRGFVSQQALIETLEEFANIDEASWARDMIVAFDIYRTPPSPAPV